MKNEIQMKKPLIAIVISIRNTKLYNRELKRLKDILKSLNNQTISYKYIEVIISDIDSDVYYQKKHKTICNQFGAKYIYTKTGKPWNISRARNIGIRHAKAAYIMTTDVDCIFSIDFIQTTLRNMDKKTIIHCRVWELPENYVGNLGDFTEMKKASILRDRGGYGTCQVFPKKWAYEVGGFDEKYVTWGAEDKDFFIRAKNDGLKIMWIENETAYFHQWHPQINRFENKSQLKNNRDRCDLTVAGELPIKRNLYGWGGKIVKNELSNVAILITTFLRDNSLYQCINSIRKYYPDIAIFIGDNGNPNKEKIEFCRKNHCKLFKLPFDSGVSKVRNESIKLMPKKYTHIVICEDDITFTEGTKLGKWKKFLDENKNIGIIGGLLKINEIKEQHYEANIRIENDIYYIEKIEYPYWRKFGEMKYFLCDLILNVFMMKRVVWDDCKWDNQFKTTFEHSNFFLQIKYNTPWKVAYTPDVWMYHRKDMKLDTDYIKYRKRSAGKALFGKKWNVKCSIPYNNKNPVMLDSKPPDYSIKDENLELAINILNRHKCKWWLDAGVCLGAVRQNNFINHDPDIDIGLPSKHLRLWNKFIEEFKESGFELYKEWNYKGKKIELSFKRRGIKLELFFFYKKGDFWWHGAFGPNEKGQWGKNMVFLPHVFSSSLFKNLKEIEFRGLKCFIPNPPEQYLVERYGEGWKKPDKNYSYWKDCKAIDKAFFKKRKTVFIGGVWDIFHIGHLNILEHAKKLGEELIVGVLTDEATRKYKPSPAIVYEQRIRIIRSLKVVCKAIKQNDSDPTKDLTKLNIRPDYIVHGNDWNYCPGEKYVKEYGGKIVFLQYTKDISSTYIKDIIKNDQLIKPNSTKIIPKKAEKGIFHDALLVKLIKHSNLAQMEKKPQVKSKTKEIREDNTKIAIGIKTFYREESLFKTLDSIKKYFPLPYRLYIADDGEISDRKEYRYQQLENEGHVIIRLPFNSGISVGRNEIIKKSIEDYILIMDDDIAIQDSKSIINMKVALEAKDNIGVCSGILFSENGDYLTSESYQKGVRFEIDRGMLFRHPGEKKIYKAGDSMYVYADQVVNFFLAKRAVFDDVMWDDRIKVEWEHLDFFLKLKETKWKAASCLNAQAVHMKSAHDSNYNYFRRSVSNNYFYHKHRIHSVTNRF